MAFEVLDKFLKNMKKAAIMQEDKEFIENVAAYLSAVTIDKKLALLEKRLEEKFEQKISEHEKVVIDKLREQQDEMLKTLKATMENTKDTIITTANIVLKDLLEDNKKLKTQMEELQKHYKEYADVVIKDGDEDAARGLTIVTKKFAEIIERLDYYRKNEVDDLNHINEGVAANNQWLNHISKQIEELTKLVKEEASNTRRRIGEVSIELSKDIRKHGDRIFDKLSRNW